MTVVSVLFLAAGAALILNAVLRGRGSPRNVFRPDIVDVGGRGLKSLLPIGLGAFLLLAGIAMLLAPLG